MNGFFQQNLLLKLNIVTGVDFQLQEFLYFNSAQFGQLRTMTSSDGISVPRLFENIIQRFGIYLASGILHDGAYRITPLTPNDLQQQQPDGTWAMLMLSESDCNALIDEALQSQGCPWLERETIYDSLQLFGWSAFDNDRNTPPIPPATSNTAKSTVINPMPAAPI